MAIPLVGIGIAAAKKAGAAVVGGAKATGATAMNVINHPVSQVAEAASVLPFGAEANIDNEEKWMEAAKRVKDSQKGWSSS